jgi:hypothetical protein
VDCNNFYSDPDQKIILRLKFKHDAVPCGSGSVSAPLSKTPQNGIEIIPAGDPGLNINSKGWRVEVFEWMTRKILKFFRLGIKHAL